MSRAHLRAVVWPRQVNEPPMQGPAGPVYRYAVVGMLVTDHPIPALDGNEHVIDGPALDVALALGSMRQVQPTHKVGDATDALLALAYLVEET